MTRFEYNRKMAWSCFWLKVWRFINWIGFDPGLKSKWFSWIISQTGYCYMWKYEYYIDEAKK